MQRVSCVLAGSCLAGWLALSLPVHAAILTVPGDFPAIQSAIDAASEGDEVVVSPGRYVENIQFRNKNLVLRSLDPTSASLVSQTVLDANQQGTAVTFGGNEGAECRLAGFTVTHASPVVHPENWTVAAIFGNHCLATIDHNQVTSNTVCGISYCDGLLLGNTVSFNAERGLMRCAGRIEGNSIHHNSGVYYGGGVVSCGGQIVGNFIFSNRAGNTGSGLYSCGGLIENNTIVGNLCPFAGSGIYLCRGTIRNCIVWGITPRGLDLVWDSTTPVASCIEGWTGGGEGNISAEPAFRNAEEADFHLLPESYCIDAGVEVTSPTLDIDGDPRVVDIYAVNRQGSDIDIGADEYVGVPDPLPAPPAPLNLDPVAGTLDLWPQVSLSCDDYASSGSSTRRMATQWQVATDPAFADVVFDSGTDYANSTSIGLPSPLEFGRRYFWRVRFLNSRRDWGPWSGSDFETRDTAIFYVPRDSASVQTAIDRVRDGEVIIVSPGRYFGTFHFDNKNIVLRSTDPEDPAVVEQTILDGHAAGTVVTFGGDEGSTCALLGLTLTGGRNSYGSGGINGRHTLATIRQCRIVGNWGYDAGGLSACDGLVDRNWIASNTTAAIGGGLSNCSGVVQNCIIVGNNAWAGGGVGDCYGTLRNNTIVKNSASKGSGLYYGNNQPPHPLVNSIVWGNMGGIPVEQKDSPAAARFCCIQEWTGGGEGVFSHDPGFLDYANDDFRLRPSSPCVDAGTSVPDLTWDYFGSLRTVDVYALNFGDSDMDIGAVEYQAAAPTGAPPSPPRIVAPLDGDANAWIRPELRCDGFVVDGSPGIDHLASQWQLSLSPDFASFLVDTGTDFDRLTTFPLSLTLERGTTYYWRARFLGCHRLWSDWTTAHFMCRPVDTIDVPGDSPTIQAALDNSWPGDEIVVARGRYKGNFVLPGWDLTLRSTDPSDPEVVADTILDGGQWGAVVLFAGSEGPDCRLAGFTVTNSNAGSASGAVDGKGCLATIERNRIVNNTTCGVVDCDGTIRYCEISDNGRGGLYACDGLISHNRIFRNKGDWGGGLSTCAATISNNWICRNTAARTGAGLYRCHGLIDHNTIAYNYCSWGVGGLVDCGGSIRNTIVWGNGTYAFAGVTGTSNFYGCCLQDAKSVPEGNFYADPLFVDVEVDDFHLRDDSPCIDAGFELTPFEPDIDGDTRPYDAYPIDLMESNVDIGADEYIGPVSSAPPLPAPTDLTPNNWDGAWISLSLGCNLAVPKSQITHLATQWQIARDADFTDRVVDSGPDPRQLRSFAVPMRLEIATKYFWRVRALSTRRGWGPWANAEFSTRPIQAIYVPQDVRHPQGAIDIAHDGDTIVVAPGTYGSVNFHNKNIVLRSTDPTSATVVEKTILRYSDYPAGTIVTFGGEEGPECRIEGFTITKGYNSENGGGINGNGCSATIQYNRILDNRATQDGGGVYSCNGLIQYNTISGNTSGHGGGGLALCNGLIRYNTIAGNKATYAGGGLYGCNGTVDGNRICGNEANYGGGLINGVSVRNNWIYRNHAISTGGGVDDNWGGVLEIENNTIVGNAAYHGGGVNIAPDRIRNCIIWGNQATKDPQIYQRYSVTALPLACVIEGWTDRSNGNLCFDPRFVDAANDDYHLRPDSPCIDAGATPQAAETDFDGGPRVVDAFPLNLRGSDVDIGADEFDGDMVFGPAPAPPQGLWPTRDTKDSWVVPLLKCGGYQALPSRDGHLATQWQMSVDTDFQQVLFDTGLDTERLTRVQVPLNLGRGFLFHWRARFISESHAVGLWSSTFTTTIDWPQILVPGDYPTIQAALDAAQAGQEIRVNEGTYYENPTFQGRNVVLRSRDPNDWNVTRNTIIDGGNHGSTVVFIGSESSTCTLEGFTITGGTNDVDYIGGGIRGYRTHATIRHNWIRDNTVRAYVNDLSQSVRAYDAHGGGIVDCAGLIESNWITGNTGVDAQGEWCSSWGMPPMCSGVYHAYGYGCGIYACEGSILNNTLYGNHIGILSSSGPTRNTIVWECSHFLGSSVDAAEYSCIQSPEPPGDTNINLDPGFVDVAGGDFHLRPDSPCIDSGGFIEGPSFDIDGEPRPLVAVSDPRGDGSGFDIGADEYSGMPMELLDEKILGRYAEIDGTDLNGDGVLDIADWITFLLGRTP